MENPATTQHSGSGGSGSSSQEVQEVRHGGSGSGDSQDAGLQTSRYPNAERRALEEAFIGRKIQDVEAYPCAVVDVAKVKRNCARLLGDVLGEPGRGRDRGAGGGLADEQSGLGFGFRAHVKTHKTTEVTKLQVGEGPHPANLIGSTLVEAENVVPLLLEYKQSGRAVNLLYGLPPAPSSVTRLSNISRALGPGGLSLLIDHSSQLAIAQTITSAAHPPLIFLKIDMGYHRAGVPPQTQECTELISAVVKAEEEGNCHLHGLYAHAGNSYGSGSEAEALDYLRLELESLLVVAQAARGESSSPESMGVDMTNPTSPRAESDQPVLEGIGKSEDIDSRLTRRRTSWRLLSPSRIPTSLRKSLTDKSGSDKSAGLKLKDGRTLVLSVGATPTATSARNLLTSNTKSSQGDSISDPEGPTNQALSTLRATLALIKSSNCRVELHAGCFPFLDVQQLATHALPTSEGLNWSDIAFTLVAEVISKYPGRGKNGTPEYLIGAGCLALGREPCKAYPGWGVVTPWNITGVQAVEGQSELPGPEDFEGWIVGKVSQEHGILSWQGKGSKTVELEVGQKVRIWPNHACIAGAGFGWYLVVDGENKGAEDVVVDVWLKWRGW